MKNCHTPRPHKEYTIQMIEMGNSPFNSWLTNLISIYKHNTYVCMNINYRSTYTYPIIDSVLPNYINI